MAQGAKPKQGARVRLRMPADVAQEAEQMSASVWFCVASAVAVANVGNAWRQVFLRWVAQ